MKREKRNLVISLFAILMVISIVGAAFASSSITIQGEVNEDYQIITDNNLVYEIGETEQGDKVGDLVGKRVEVTGTVHDDEDGKKVITVTSFKVLK